MIEFQGGIPSSMLFLPALDILVLRHGEMSIQAVDDVVGGEHLHRGDEKNVCIVCKPYHPYLCS